MFAAYGALVYTGVLQPDREEPEVEVESVEQPTDRDVYVVEVDDEVELIVDVEEDGDRS
jgi:hypothetical protein